MKKILKFLGIGIGLLIVFVMVTAFIVNESLPKGESGAEADALANKMLKALNHEKYKSTRFLEWSFRNGKNHYKWDKENEVCIIQWDSIQVDLNLIDPAKSHAKKNGEFLNGKEGNELIKKALDNFNNDSFWLVAPYKVFDKGTTRSTVDLEDGSKGLLVTYTSGGTTPGDSYLWQLNPDGFPNSYKMWVKILPIGGLEASWDDWMVTESGAFLPKRHQMGPITFSMGNVKGYNE